MTTRRVPVARPSFGPEEERLVCETLRSGWVAQGPRVAELETRFAERVGAAHAVAVSSGTAGLFLSLHALGVGPGDEVVVPSLSFIATANAVVHAGATPVFVDVDPRTYNVDPVAVAEAITPRTRAIMVVHQLGLPCDLPALESVARSAGVPIVEDSACAIGSRLDGTPIGASANLGCFSFHARKVVVMGEGGMITTPDGGLAERLRRLRHQGMSLSDLERHRASRVIIEDYPEIGYNFRLSDLQAAVGLAQLAKVDAFVARRRALAARYDAALAELPPLVAPHVPPGATPNYQSYVVRLAGAGRERRGALLDALHARGVGSRRGLMAAHLEPCYARLPPRTPLPHTVAAEAETFLLPIYADLDDDDQGYVIDALRAALTEILGGEAR